MVREREQLDEEIRDAERSLSHLHATDEEIAQVKRKIQLETEDILRSMKADEN